MGHGITTRSAIISYEMNPGGEELIQHRSGGTLKDLARINLKYPVVALRNEGKRWGMPKGPLELGQTPRVKADSVANTDAGVDFLLIASCTRGFIKVSNCNLPQPRNSDGAVTLINLSMRC